MIWVISRNLEFYVHSVEITEFFCHSEAPKFDFYEFLHSLEYFRAPNMVGNGIFRTLDFPKLISRKI